LAARQPHALAGAAARALKKRGPAVEAPLFPWSRTAAHPDVETVTEEAMYRAAHDPDPRVRSRVMTLLGETPSPTAALLLRRALHDIDSRVQANAIEALDGLNVERLETLIAEKLESPNARVRANAVQALLRRRARKAGHALFDMLASQRPGERLSGLWVAERMQLDSLLNRIEEVAGCDPDAQVRERAARLMVRLARTPRPSADRKEVEVLSR
jgi:HEAT repeat protein